MQTTDTKTKKSVSKKSIDLTDFPSLPETLSALQYLRTAKNHSDSQIHPILTKAYNECKKSDCVLMIERIMLHIGDVSRQHNILKEMGIISPNGGAQERAIFRSCMRWWEKNIPESFVENLHLFVEFTLYENLMYYQNTTDRSAGKLVKSEILFPCHQAVWEFLAAQIRKGKDLDLIAKHLPKKYSGNDSRRKTTKVVKYKKGQKSFEYTIPTNKSWVKINGELVPSETKTFPLKPGDVISYPRDKQSFTLTRQKYINKWIAGFCEVMGWTEDQYRKFRSQQNTPEQLFSSRSVLNITEVDFGKVLNKLTSGQRFRVAKMLAYKDGNDLKPKEKWGKLGQWYINWELNQEKIANELRMASVDGDTEKTKALMKDFKVKSIGVQTVDLLVQIFKGVLNDTQINNTYQSLIEKMDLIANVFPIVDGSGSMDDTLLVNGVKIRNRDIAYAMCIAFSTRNPVEAFKNTYGWFSRNFYICGDSKFIDESPNQYVSKTAFRKPVKGLKISDGQTFTQNLAALKGSDPGEVSSTNMFSSVEFFVKLVQEGRYHVEDLPAALLYITDNENNTGKSPKEAITLANSIGWHPLLIFWGLRDMSEPTKNQLKNLPNALYVGGFNEGVLSQILRNIKTGSINPETELWSIYNDKRYSLLS